MAKKKLEETRLTEDGLPIIAGETLDEFFDYSKKNADKYGLMEEVSQRIYMENRYLGMALAQYKELASGRFSVPFELGMQITYELLRLQAKTNKNKKYNCPKEKKGFNRS